MPRSRSPEPSSHSSSKRSKHSSHRDRSLSPPAKRSRDDDDRRRDRDRDSDRRPRDHRDDDYRRSDRDRDSSRRSGESDRDRERERERDRDRDRRDREPDRRTRDAPHSSSSSSSRLPTNGAGSPNGHHHAASTSYSSAGRGGVPSPSTGSVRASASSHSSFQPAHPSSSSSIPAPTPAPAPELSAEEKLKAKRERLAAWKAKQGGGSGGASPTPGSPAPSSATATATPSAPASISIGSGIKKPAFASIPAKPTFSFGGGGGGGGAGAALSRIGLPLKPSALSKSSMAIMDDGPAPVRKLEKLGALPAVDTSLVVVPHEEEEEDLDYEFKASVKGGERGPTGTAAAASTAEAMEVDPTPPAAAATSAMVVEEDDEEVDPLDAYMLGVTQERVKVDLEDSSRMKGGPGGPKRGRALGVDDDEGGGEGSDEDGEGAGEGDRPITAEDIIAMAAAKNRRKELPTVDHSTVTYEPFRKAFYTPPYEVTQMTDDEVDLMRLEMDGIKIRGVDCPRPVKRWGAFGLPGGCLEVIKRLGYEEPTSIQAQAIPAIMSGRDVIGVAKTGSGKTIAFLLPLLRHINDQPPLEPGDGPMAVIMTPTRELALQIVKECKPFAKVLGITAMAAYGGSPIGEQISELKKGAEIVVGTPGRMIDLLTANSGRVTNLKRVTYLVLDEADRMFDMGFEPQVMKIINNVRPGRQIVLFSATFPKQMDGLARKILQKPLEVTVGGRSVVGKEIEQLVEVRTEETKFNRLLELLGETYQAETDLNEKRTLIFVERQEAADNLLLQLHQKSYRRVNSLHGGKEQVDRDETINNFKSGVLPIVIATSVAARGLDVKQLVLVINYDVPNHMEDYVHRAGRTGRAGNKGTCVTFITPDQEKFAVDISRAVEASYAARIPPLPAPERFQELKALADGFLAKVRSGAVKSFSNTGFGGKGLERFESDRESKEQAERSAFGEEAGEKKDDKKDGDKPAPGGKDANGEFTLDGFNVDIVKGPAPERTGGARGPGSNQHRPVLPVVPSIPMALVAGGPNQEGVNKVQAALNKINAELAAKKRAMQQAAANPPPPPPAPVDGAGAGVTQKTVLSTDRKPKDPDATDYHAVVMINDFVQKARWMVTNRESIVKLIDLTGTAITNRGIFYEPGKEPPEGAEPKLSLLVESNDEWRVEMAVKEIKRLLIEGTILGLAHEQRNPGTTGGRYQIN